MTIKYKNSPITEAICEFQFVSDSKWDNTIPGIMYEKVKNKFPIKQQQHGMTVQITPKEAGFDHSIEQAPPRSQFFNKSKKALIQVGPDLLAVNRLKPYISWMHFKKFILNNLRIYKKEANPSSFRRIGLRYINRFEFQMETVEFEDYFSFYPHVPEALPNLFAFLSRVEVPYSDGRDRLLLTLAPSKATTPGNLIIIFDLDYILVEPKFVSFTNVEEWLNNAYTTLETTFESCITDKCREMLGVIP